MNILNSFTLNAVAKSPPNFEEGTMQIGFDGISGIMPFGNQTDFPLDCEVKEGDLIVIEGHIAVLSDFDEVLSPMADVVRKA